MWKNIPRIKIIRFYGTKGSFAVGADIKTLKEYSAVAAKKFSLLGNKLFNLISDDRFITIAEIDGYCMGGGVDFAASCDFRFATRKSVFAHPGVNLGFITGFGGTARIPRITKFSFVKEFFYTGHTFKANEMLNSGFLLKTFESTALMHKYTKDFINKLKIKNLLYKNELYKR